MKTERLLERGIKHSDAQKIEDMLLSWDLENGRPTFDFVFKKKFNYSSIQNQLYINQIQKIEAAAEQIQVQQQKMFAALNKFDAKRKKYSRKMQIAALKRIGKSHLIDLI
jgi:hypothetical protein